MLKGEPAMLLEHHGRRANIEIFIKRSSVFVASEPNALDQIIKMAEFPAVIA
jgi:hypothetical protein